MMDWATSMKEVNDIYRVTRQIEAQRQREKDMEFKVGDKVKLKDSPYAGRIASTWGGTSSFQPDGYDGALTADNIFLEHTIDPQVGDIYLDTFGHEWVVLQYGSRTKGSDPFLIVQLIGVRPGNYPHRSFVLATHGKRPSNLEMWITTYAPKLVRRREQ